MAKPNTWEEWDKVWHIFKPIPYDLVSSGSREAFKKQMREAIENIPGERYGSLVSREQVLDLIDQIFNPPNDGMDKETLLQNLGGNYRQLGTRLKSAFYCLAPGSLF